MGLFEIENDDFLGQGPKEATTIPTEKITTVGKTTSAVSTKSKSIKFINKHGKINQFKKRELYQEKDNYESELSNNNCNIEDNKFTKHYFNKSIYTEINELKGKYGLDIKNLLKEVNMDSISFLESNKNNLRHNDNEENELQLWVEKYKPWNVMDIVGHEDHKIEILKWLKMWSLSTNNIANKFSEENINDPYRRPDRKVILIEGKIGIGKNTLAEVLSKTCGYDLLEMDNSENNRQQLKQKISNILFSKNTVMGKNVTNCLLVDDSSNDSSDIFSILQEFLKKDEKETNNCITYSFNSSLSKAESKSFLKSKQSLLRKPIICLTENINSKRLSHIKQYCEIVRLKQPSLSKIVEFLQSILFEELQLENSKVQKDILSRLVESCNGDLRNSLNNLQFDTLENELLFGNNNADVLLGNNSNTSINGKDKSKSWYSIFVELFEPHNAQKDLSSVIAKFTKLLDPFQNSYSNMINMSFDNYPVLIPNIETSSVAKYSKNFNNLSDSLYFWDVLNSFDATTGRLPQYGVVPLLNFAVYNYRIHEGSSMSYKNLNQNIIKYNVWYTKSLTVQQDIKEIIELFRNTHNYVDSGDEKDLTYNDFNQNNQQLTQEYLPTLASLLSIDIMGSLKSNEKRDKILLDLFYLFKSKGIRFVRTKVKGDKGSMNDSIVLSTDITEVSNFTNFDIISCNHKNIRPGDKLFTIPTRNPQLTNLKNDDTFLKVLGNSIVKNQSITSAKNFKFILKKFEEFSHQTAKSSTFKRKLDDTPTPANKKVKTTYTNKRADAFSFAKKVSSDGTEVVSVPVANSEGRVWIKYKEGFSNAVKKQLTWDSFF